MHTVKIKENYIMADRISPEQRSVNMSHIRSKDTSIEIKIRKYLFSQGFRFRKNVRSLPGTPDIVLPKYKAVIFIHGCYWHRHKGCKYATTPKTRTEFWLTKFERTLERDASHIASLESSGWHVYVIWECEIENQFEETMAKLVTALHEVAKKLE
jgi:DNA mismatch endonuclease (patch repair protein)